MTNEERLLKIFKIISELEPDSQNYLARRELCDFIMETPEKMMAFLTILTTLFQLWPEIIFDMLIVMDKVMLKAKKRAESK